MEQSHWAVVGLVLLAVLVIGIGANPDGSGWIAGLGVALLAVLALIAWRVWQLSWLVEELVQQGQAERGEPEEAPADEPAAAAPRRWGGAELHLWLRAITTHESREETTFRLYNAGESYALHVVLHPLHAEWERRIAHQVFDPTAQDIDGVERWMRMTARGSFRAPLMPAGRAVDLQLAGPTGPGTAICVRWDDPESRLRRWRCWQMAVSGGGRDDRPRRELRALRGPDPTACDRCPERLGGVCPHLLARNAPDALHDIAASLYGYEDWLERS